MALSGLHLAFGYAGGPGYKSLSLPVIGTPVLSETIASAGTSTIAAPALGSDNTLGRIGQPIASVRSSADAWIAFGPAPNASSGARRFIPANTDYDFFVQPGDKLAWIAA